MAQARPLQVISLGGNSPPGSIFASSATPSERRKAQLPQDSGQFCAHRETVGKSRLPQVQPQPCLSSSLEEERCLGCPLPFALSLGFPELPPWEELGPHG